MMTETTGQSHRRRDGVCELLVETNLFSFRVWQEQLYVVIYHCRACRTPQATYLFGCGLGCLGCTRQTLQWAMGKPRYTPEHAAAGLDFKFPEIETWPNQFSGYEIVVDDPEFTSVCPKTGLPDFGMLAIRYMPDKSCLELKSLKEYLQSYRNLGIFQENIVNQVLEDVVKWAKPVWAEVKGEFRPRGGISTTIVARWPRPKSGKH